MSFLRARFKFTPTELQYHTGITEGRRQNLSLKGQAVHKDQINVEMEDKSGGSLPCFIPTLKWDITIKQWDMII